jgi:hypothetical protein
MKKMKVKGWAIVATSDDEANTQSFAVSGIAHSVGYTGVGFYEAQSLADTALKYFKDLNKNAKNVRVVPVILEMREVSKEEWETALP